jgi:hypothetical protein
MVAWHASLVGDNSVDGGRSVAALTAAMALGLAVAVYLLARILHDQRGADTSARAMPTAEETAYLANIKASRARMSVAQNFLGSSVYYLSAEVTNAGPKTVRALDLQLEFLDPFNQVVLRDTVHPITPAVPPLKPGETRPFRVTYEHISAEWNQAPPRMTPVAVRF